MSKGYPTTVVAVLCLVSFFAGRFFQLPRLPDATGPGPTTVYKNNNGNRKSLREIPDESLTVDTHSTRRGGLPLEDNRFEISPHLLANRNFSSFEELLEASGMLAGHPPLTPGATGHSFYTMQPMQLLSWYPRAFIFPRFMDKAKCDHVKKIAEARLSPSGLALKRGETADSTREIRTSQGTFLGRNDDPEGVLAWIEDKIAVLTGIPAGHGEAFNILRYENGQHYDSHYDAFTEEEYGKQKSHRVATVLLYLTDVEEGGETVFLFEGKEGLKRLAGVDYKACNTGIKVKPRAGDALLFWSQNPDTTVDKHSLHGGCPVIAGNKFVATKWIRDKCTGGGTCLGGTHDIEITRYSTASATTSMLGSCTDPQYLPYFPAILLPLYETTGAIILPAVVLGAIADAISGCALYNLALSLNLPTTDAADVMTMFLWNPLSIASCVSGSADPLRLCALFAAAATAATGTRLGRAGACFALALHFDSSSQLLLMAIPLIMLSLRKNFIDIGSSKSPNCDPTTTATTLPRASFSFLAGFLFTFTVVTIASHHLIHKKYPTLSTLLDSSYNYISHNYGKEETRPWSNIEPNLGLQWYLFAEVLPPFRHFYEYVFWAVSAALCVPIALRFGQKNPLVVLVMQGIVLCLLSRHPTCSDIMVWLGLLPLVLLLLRRQGQEKNKKEKCGGADEGAGETHVKMWLAVGFCICLVLNTAAYELWLTLGTGNANFFYGMNLVWAAWQAIALVYLLKTTSALEEEDA